MSVYDILLEHKINNVTLSDINADLIFLYKNIINNRELLINSIINIEEQFLKTVPDIHNENIKLHLYYANLYFKDIRKEFNSNKGRDSVEQSANFIFLQKHSFNGIYRENSKGEYNTPFNWNGTSNITDICNKINSVYNVFGKFNIEFLSGSYDKIEFVDDIVYYLDPPYINENSDTENKYNKSGFLIKEQLNLLNKIKGKSFIYSNNKSEVVLSELLQNKDIKIQYVNRKNNISPNSTTRGNEKIEILATNKVIS